MTPKPLNTLANFPTNDEQTVARWLCAPEQQRAMIRVVMHVIAREPLPAPYHVRRHLLADEALHEDIIAEARTTYLVRWREGRAEEGKELSFLKGITAFTTRTITRTEARRRAIAVPAEVADLANQLRAAGLGPDDALAARKKALCLRRVLDRLPADRRAVFVTYVFEGPEAVEYKLGMRRERAKVIIHRIMKDILAALAK